MKTVSANLATLDDIAPWREMYRREMACQIIHDSIHDRPGWTREYSLLVGDVRVGYGSLAIAGPWQDKPSLYEFYVAEPFRTRMFDLFEALVSQSGAVAIETQSNDPLLTVMLHAWSPEVQSESILFHDRFTTQHAPAGAVFRRATPADVDSMEKAELDTAAGWVVEVDGAVAAAGDVLYHYNRPYGDVYMKVAEPLRRRGLGAFIVQELKRTCYEGGSVPGARCRTTNVASRRTLQKAGFVPCGHILVGNLSS